MSVLELTGLRGHHPLGFLAACGLLRCCGGAEGGRKVSLAWKQADDKSGWVAVLHRGKDLELESLARLLIRQARTQRNSPALTWSTKIDNQEKFRELGSTLISDDPNPCAQEGRAFLPALASDMVVDGEKRLKPTSLDLTSGNQRFLDSIRKLSTNLSTPPKRGGQAQSGTDAFREALFGPWQYRDGTHSLGWDPQTQRLHALRHKLPEQDKQNRSVRGAVFLASQALPMFPCFAVGGKLRTTSFHHDDDGDWFAWPIWREPISLDTLRCLLAQPFNEDLKRRGVVAGYRCLRARTGGAEGNYRVFSNAEERTAPPSQTGRRFKP